MDEAAKEKEIYTVKICSTCGAKSKKPLQAQLYPAQRAFLEQAAQKYGLPTTDVSDAPHPSRGPPRPAMRARR